MNQEDQTHKIALSDETMDKLAKKISTELASSITTILLDEVAAKSAKAVGFFVFDKLATIVGITLLGVYYFFGDKFK
jgi:hypothetical protein